MILVILICLRMIANVSIMIANFQKSFVSLFVTNKKRNAASANNFHAVILLKRFAKLKNRLHYLIRMLKIYSVSRKDRVSSCLTFIEMFI